MGTLQHFCPTINYKKKNEWHGIPQEYAIHGTRLLSFKERCTVDNWYGKEEGKERKNFFSKFKYFHIKL